MTEAITIAPDGQRWTVQHRGSVLGHTATRAEAMTIGRSLVDWLHSEGRAAAVVEAEEAPSAPARGVAH